MPQASALQFQDYTFQVQTPLGIWRWTTRVDVSGPSPQYDVRNIFSPCGLIRDRTPIPGYIIQAMASGIADLQTQFAPTITVIPVGLVFVVDEGRGFSDSQSVQVTNTGVYGSLLNVTFSLSAGFVSVTPPSVGNLASNEDGFFEVAVDSTALLEINSPYVETITLQDGSATNSPQVVTVTITVRPKATIALSPAMLTFFVVKPISGPYPPIPVQTFLLQNTGLPTSVLEYLIQKLTGCGTWITGISPSSGTLPGGGSQLVTITVAPTESWPTGTYTETLRVSGYSSNFYQDIIVQLIVT